MSDAVRRLRRVYATARFEEQVKALSPRERESVKSVVGSLRKAETLPGPEDSRDMRPPVAMHYLRRVPTMNECISYDINDDDTVSIYCLKVPPYWDGPIDFLLNAEDDPPDSDK